MKFKPNKRLYIVFNPSDQVPLGFSDDQFLLDNYGKESPVPVYTKKVAKKLIEVDELSRKAKGWPAQPLAMAPINLPFEYRHRPLTHEEVQEDKGLQEPRLPLTKDNTTKTLDWYFDNLESLVGRKDRVSDKEAVMILGKSPEGEVLGFVKTPEEEIANDPDSLPLTTISAFLPGYNNSGRIQLYSRSEANELILLQVYDDKQKGCPGWHYFTVPVDSHM